MPGLIDHVAERNRATIINALESVLGHAAHDLFRQVSRVVFGVAFQHRFQNDALRASRNDFCCRHQFHTIAFQLGLVPCAVVTVPGKAVQLPDNDDIKDPALAVFDHLLKLRAVVRLGGDGTVNVSQSNFFNRLQHRWIAYRKYAVFVLHYFLDLRLCLTMVMPFFSA